MTLHCDGYLLKSVGARTSHRKKGGGTIVAQRSLYMGTYLAAVQHESNLIPNEAGMWPPGLCVASREWPQQK
jgi:hypothetical protein